jgi:hypothetical protein
VIVEPDTVIPSSVNLALAVTVAVLSVAPPSIVLAPVTSIVPRPPIVPPLIVAPLTVSLPVASTVTLPAFATVEPWSIVSAPSHS